MSEDTEIWRKVLELRLYLKRLSTNCLIDLGYHRVSESYEPSTENDYKTATGELKHS